MSIQTLFDAWSAQMQKERAASQMTLGALIATLEAMPADTQVPAIASPHSYRGYYEDLAFAPSQGSTISASSLLDECMKCMGREFTGYKGGEFAMSESTPVWIAEYGCTGMKLVEFGPQRILMEKDE